MIFVPVKKLMRKCNPFGYNNPWRLERFTRRAIQKAIDEKDFVAVPVNFDESRERHIARVAYLVVNEATDPIEIDVGVPGLGCWVEWPIQDGNHRFTAAVFAKKEFIAAEVSGDVKYAKKILGVDI